MALSNKNPFTLLQGRLGNRSVNTSNKERTNLDALYLSNEKLKVRGGVTVQERMIKDKRKSLQSALWNSYQGADIVKIDATDKTPFRVLINPNKLTQDYDNKILSVGFEYDIQCGDVFEWVGTNSYWLVYLQELTELAYFRGSIRRCTYQIAWQDEDGEHVTYAALKGPTEGNIASTRAHGMVIDTPNYSISFLVPQTEVTKKQFKRYSKFYLQGCDTCWRVEGVDTLSSPGIIEVYAKEYYANKDEDDINNGIVGGLVREITPNTPAEEMTIRGETFIKVKQTAEYRFDGLTPGIWKVDDKYPVVLQINDKDPRKVTIKWTASYSGQFELWYGDYSKTIVVESLF